MKLKLLIILLLLIPMLCNGKKSNKGNKSKKSDNIQLIINTDIIKDITEFHITNDNKYLISGGTHNRLCVWDFQTGELLRMLTPYQSYKSISAVTVSDDNKYIVSTVDGSLCLWDLESGKLIKKTMGSRITIGHVKFIPNTQYVYYSDKNGLIKAWDLQKGKKIKLFTVEHPVRDIFYAEDRGVVVVVTSGAIYIWSHRNITLLHTINIIPDWCDSAILTADNNYILTAGDKKRVTIYDINTGEKVKHYLEHEQLLDFVTLSHDEKQVITYDNAGTIRIWDFQTGELTRYKDSHDFIKSDLWNISITPDKKNIIVDEYHRGLKIWNIETGNTIDTFNKHITMNSSLALFKNDYLYIGNRNGDINVWDMHETKLHNTLKGHSGRVGALMITGDKKYLISGGDDKTIRIRDVKTGELIHIFEGHEEAVVSLALSRDYRYLISGSFDKNIIIWDLKTFEQVKVLKGHEDRIISVATTNDNKYIVSYSVDGKVIFWDLQELALTKSVDFDMNDKIKETYIKREQYYLARERWNTVSVIYNVRKQGDKVVYDSDPVPNALVTEISNDTFYIDYDIINYYVTITGKKKNKVLASIYHFNDGEWLITTPDHYYNASPNVEKHISFFEDGKLYNAEDFSKQYKKTQLFKDYLK